MSWFSNEEEEKNVKTFLWVKFFVSNSNSNTHLIQGKKKII